MKIDAQGLKYCDLEKAAAEPELGRRAGLVGYMGGKLTRHTLDLGIVSSTSRDRGTRFQIDALLNYGNSGGPVITSQGRLLGIGLAPISPQTILGRLLDRKELSQWTMAPNSGVSMVCRMDRLLPALRELKAGKSTATRSGAFLGVSIDPKHALSDEVVIGAVLPDSAANKAGLKAGDRILKIDGQSIRGLEGSDEPRQPTPFGRQDQAGSLPQGHRAAPGHQRAERRKRGRFASTPAKTQARRGIPRQARAVGHQGRHCHFGATAVKNSFPFRGRNIVAAGSLAWICLRICLCAGGTAAGETVAPSPDIPALCQRVKPAYVFIAGGSGAIVSSNGWMLTNSHVVNNDKQFDVRTGDGRHYRARLLGRDVSGDLAVLQLELKPHETTPFLEIDDPETLHVGDYALAVGNPFAEGLIDQNPTFTLGVISALNQAVSTSAVTIATDAALNPGNSGGPLIDMAGRLAGINGQIATRWGLRSNTGLGYAISSRQIRLWLPRLARANGGNVLHGGLSGVEFASVRASDGKVPKITDIAPGSAAEKAGFKLGDRIAAFDGRPIATASQLAQAIHIYPQDQEVAVRVQRNGKDLNLKLKLPAVRHASLGIKLSRPGKDDQHVRVGELANDSPAQQAGLQAGDEIVAIDRVQLNMAAAAQFAILSLWLEQGVNVGDIVRIEVRRKGPDGKTATREIRVVTR